MNRYLFLILFLALPALAVDSIYTWGYGSDIREILTGVKLFVQNGHYFISAAIVIALLLATYKLTKEDNTDKLAKTIFVAILASNLFFYTQKDYMIEDEVTNQAWAVTDIPVGIGELFSIFTTLERITTTAFESSYSTPNSISYSNAGLGFSMRAHLAIDNVAFIDGAAHETFMDYTTNCIASGMLDGSISKDLIQSENIVDEMKVTGYETIVYKSDGSFEQMSCQDAYDNYIKPNFILESDSYIQNRLAATLALDPAVVNQGLQDTSSLFFGISKSGRDYVMQKMGMNMLQKGMHVMAMTTGGDTQALAYGTAVSQATIENQWQQTGMMAQQTLPMTKAYLIAALVAITPLLALLAIIYSDWKHIVMLVNLLLTMMLWGPMMSIINFLMYLRLEVLIPKLTGGLWMPMLAMREVNSSVASYLNYLSYASMSVPLLTYSIIKASEMGFVNYMTSVGGSVSGGANAGANQKTTGANLGNTRVGQGSYTGAEGVTNDMGGGATQTSRVGHNGEYGSYESKTTSNLYGDSHATIDNGVATISTSNGEIQNVQYQGISGDISQSLQSSRNEALTHESAAMQTLASTLANGDSQSMANGQVLTNGDTLSKNTGLDMSTSNAVVSSTNETYAKDLENRLAEAERNGTREDFLASIGASASAGSPDLLKSISGFKVGVDGKISATSGADESKSFDFSMSSGESQNYQKILTDNLTKAYTENESVALQHAKGVVDNEVYSDTSIKSDMDNYTKAASIADKYTDAYSRTNGDTASLTQNALSLVTEDFIKQDERLNGYYENGSLEQKQDAMDEATKRVAAAIESGNGTDYRTINDLFQDRTGLDLNGSLSLDVNDKINDYKANDHTAQDIQKGYESVNDHNVDNTINNDIKETYDNQKDSFTNNAKDQVNGHKEANTLNTENTIDKSKDILDARREEFKEQSKSGTAITGMADNAEDVFKGVDNISKFTSHDGYDGFKSDFKPSTEFIENTYQKAHENGFISNNTFSDDSIKDPSKMQNFSNNELLALYDNDKSFYHMDESSRDMIRQELLNRETINGNTSNLSNVSTDLSSVKNQIGNLQDDFEAQNSPFKNEAPTRKGDK